MPQSLCPLARPGERLLPLIRSLHLYYNWPINKTEIFGMKRDAKARNITTALAHLHSASLNCRGRRVIPRRSVTASLQVNLAAFGEVLIRQFSLAIPECHAEPSGVIFVLARYVLAPLGSRNRNVANGRSLRCVPQLRVASQVSDDGDLVKR